MYNYILLKKISKSSGAYAPNTLNVDPPLWKIDVYDYIRHEHFGHVMCKSFIDLNAPMRLMFAWNVLPLFAGHCIERFEEILPRGSLLQCVMKQFYFLLFRHEFELLRYLIEPKRRKRNQKRNTIVSLCRKIRKIDKILKLRSRDHFCISCFILIMYLWTSYNVERNVWDIIFHFKYQI